MLLIQVSISGEHNPYAPCMIYLPTFTVYRKFEPNVGKYSIHGAFG